MITDSIPHYRLNEDIIGSVLKGIFPAIQSDGKFNIREVNDVYKFDVPRLLTDPEKQRILNNRLEDPNDTW